MCCMYTVYNKFRQTEREKELFSLKGGKHREQRMRLYTFLLSHMADPHRFQLTAKLCQEVCVCVCALLCVRWSE